MTATGAPACERVSGAVPRPAPATCAGCERLAEVVRERDRLWLLVASLAERVAAQSELLARRAEGPKGGRCESGNDQH